jgi:hypothetical protein
MKRLAFGMVIAILASTWTSAQFVQQGEKLVGTGAVGPAGQGACVAVSADGDTAIVGGWLAGAAWVFTRSGGEWTQQGDKLLGGFEVALSADGNTAILGVDGGARVFTRSGSAWTQQAGKLVGSGAVGEAPQGDSVAISADGNTAIVGGPLDNNHLGAAWVFTRSGGVWTQQGPKLVGAGAGGSFAHQGDSVALSADGNTALVGGGDDDSGVLGAAWVFTRSGGVWTQQGPKLVGTGAAGPTRQGVSVGMSADGSTAIVGGPWDNDGVGAAWVFTRSGGVWTQQGAKLVGTGPVMPALNPFMPDISVALSGDGTTAVVGRSLDNGGIGAAWVFTRSAGVWTQYGEKLVGTGAGFQGSSVAVSGDGTTAIVGGEGDNGGMGAAWVFTRVGGVGNALWVPVVAHAAGLNDSEWRSDLGLLNTGTTTGNVQLTFHGPDGVVTNTTYVPAASQSVLVDVVAQLPASGQGALEISSDQPIRVTSRTYNQASADAICDPNGTQGQSYPTLAAGDGLSQGQAAWLPHLVENAAYRTNIGMVNSSAAAAEVTVELYDGAGGLLTSYTVSLAPGEWKQETQPFQKKAGQAAMDRGYAKVSVTSGSGVSAFASVIDNITNDPTTITMQQ